MQILRGWGAELAGVQILRGYEYYAGLMGRGADSAGVCPELLRGVQILRGLV